MVLATSGLDACRSIALICHVSASADLAARKMARLDIKAAPPFSVRPMLSDSRSIRRCCEQAVEVIVAKYHPKRTSPASPIKNVSAGVIGISNFDFRFSIWSSLQRSMLQDFNALLSFSTFVTADLSISIFTLSATFTITVVSFTLEIRP